MEKTKLAAHVIAASLPRDTKFDVLKDENYWLKDQENWNIETAMLDFGRAVSNRGW